MSFYTFAHNFVTISAVLQIKMSSCRANHDGSFKNKAISNFAQFLVPKEGKNAPSIYLVLEAPILIRNHSLTSEESKAKSRL